MCTYAHAFEHSCMRICVSAARIWSAKRSSVSRIAAVARWLRLLRGFNAVSFATAVKIVARLKTCRRKDVDRLFRKLELPKTNLDPRTKNPSTGNSGSRKGLYRRSTHITYNLAANIFSVFSVCSSSVRTRESTAREWPAELRSGLRTLRLETPG